MAELEKRKAIIAMIEKIILYILRQEYIISHLVSIKEGSKQYGFRTLYSIFSDHIAQIALDFHFNLESELSSFLLVCGSGFILRPSFFGGGTRFMHSVELVPQTHKEEYEDETSHGGEPCRNSSGDTREREELEGSRAGASDELDAVVRSGAGAGAVGDVATECAYLTLWRADLFAIARAQNAYLERRSQLTSI